MKNTIRLFVILAMIMAMMPQGLFAQTATTRTSLSAAITSANATSMTVLSATGFTASTQSVGQYAYMDKEAVLITSVAALVIGIRRGQLGTVATPHLSTAFVWAGPRDVFISAEPSGRCTRANETYLPQVHTVTGNVYDCILGPSAATGVTTQNTTSYWTNVNFLPESKALPYKKLRPETTAYTALVTDEIIGFNTNVAGTITLPAPTGLFGKTYLVQLEITGTVSVTIATSAGQTINGAASIIIGGRAPGTTTDTNFQSALLYYDGSSRWFAHIGRGN